MASTLRALLDAPEQAESLPPDAIAPVLGELIILLAQLLLRVAPPALPTPKEDEAQRLLTIREAATRLGFTPAYLYALIRHRRFPALRSGKHLRVLPRDLDEWVRRHRDEGVDTKGEPSLVSPLLMTTQPVQKDRRSR